MRVLWLSIAIVGILGLAENFRISTPERRKQMFVFYTNLSNLLVTVFYLLLAILPANGGLKQWLLTPLCRIGVAWLISVTILIYHFVLAVTIRKLPGDDPQHMRFFTPANILVHYIVPLSTLAEWFFFADKSGLTIGSCANLLLLPLIYTGFLLIRPYLGGGVIRDMNSFYPYPFLDVDRLGYVKVVGNILFATAALFLWVVLFWVISAGLSQVFG